jgi:uncharacterized protein YjaZ
MRDPAPALSTHRTADKGNVSIEVVDVLAGQRAMFSETSPGERRRIGNERVAGPLRPWWEPMTNNPWMPATPEIGDPLGYALMLQIAPPEMDGDEALAFLARFEEAGSVRACADALVATFDCLAPTAHGIALPTIRYTLALANPSLRTERDGNAAYTGFGGNPGAIMMIALPDDYNLPRLAAMAAHEAHHNVRLSQEPWEPATITVGQYIVLEGLAEAFAAEMFDEDALGPWTVMHDEEVLRQHRATYRNALELMGDPRPYMFGDWAAEEFHYEAKGLPNYIGYGMGYRVVRSYLEASGATPAEATYVPWREIAEGAPWLWEDA